MTIAWLFGDEIERPGAVQIQPRVFDIDIVYTVYRMMLGRAEQDLREYEATPDYQEHKADPEWPDVRRRHEDLERSRPVVVLSNMDAIASPEEIPIESVRDLESYDRKRLQLQGAGIHVIFHHRFPPSVSKARPDASEDLFQKIIDQLRKSGRRRAQRYSLLAALPLVLTTIVTALGIWTLIDTRAPLSLWIFVLALLVVLWAPAVWASWWVSKTGRLHMRAGAQKIYFTVGHRFREGSLSAVRDRLVSARATAITSLWTVPLGAIVGYFLTRWLGTP